jgi:hypothetical protein
VFKLHPAGDGLATVTGRITNHKQNIREAVEKSSESNTTVIRDGMARCSNLQRERNSY